MKKAFTIIIFSFIMAVLLMIAARAIAQDSTTYKYHINHYDTIKGNVEFWSTPKQMQKCDWSYTESFSTFDRKRKYVLDAIKVVNNMTNQFRIFTRCGEIDQNKEFYFHPHKTIK